MRSTTRIVAGRIVELLGWERTDAAEAAARLAATWSGAEEAFRASKSGRNLMENAPELEADIPFCARESVLDVVPRLVGAARRRRRDRAVIVNRDPKVRGPYTAFAEVAGAYERGRPGYPDEAFRWLVGDEPRDVVDLGAGTGKLTRALVALGHRVTRSSRSTRCAPSSRRRSPSVARSPGSAEAIPLPDASADVVTSAQAFHWFDHDDALPEIARVLRPGGRLALVWNSRDDRDPWMARLSEIIGNETIEESDVRPGPRREWPLRTGRDGAVLVRAGARSRGAARPRPLAQLLREAAAAGARADPGRRRRGCTTRPPAPDGVRLAYVTECFRAERR